MKRIIMHWTAGGSRASADDKTHYHRLVEYDGTIVAGTEAIEDNIVTSDGDYAAHTLGLNTGSIGVSMCGMRGAVENPFDAGPSPVTEKQFRAFCIMVADLARQYAIPITPETVLTHAEVEPNLGVKQRGKWDFTRLPFRDDLRGAKPVGDYFRKTILEVMGVVAPVETQRPILRFGDRGPMVKDLQGQLAALGYFTGKIDGDFGKLTRASVLAMQADIGVTVDGVVGNETWAALRKAPAKSQRDVTMKDLRKAGSETIKAADRAEIGAGAGVVATGLALAGQVTDHAKSATAAIGEAKGALDGLQGALIEYWPLLVVVSVLGVVWWSVRAVKARRLHDAKTGANVAR